MHGLRRALYGIPARAARERIKQFIAFFDLGFDTLTDGLLGAYSKGMRRKVVNTAALLHNPPVVLFDEPLEGLDANAAVGFKTLIQTLAHRRRGRARNLSLPGDAELHAEGDLELDRIALLQCAAMSVL